MADSLDLSGTTTPTAPSKSSLKREAKRLEKATKNASKSVNSATSAVVGAVDKKVKEKKEREKEDDYVEIYTPKGEKKDMSKPMPQSYNPLEVEAAWYDWWLAQGFFKPEYVNPSRKKNNPNGKEPFVIPSPPPNVTGSLHIGHALTVAIQDGLVRWYRMLGHPTLFVPGFDHAGISTQSVVEKRLWKKEGKTKHDLGREEFLKSVWGWKEDYQERITNQLRRLGGSYDWDRVAFTMDEKLSKGVVETFCRLHEAGIIYRGNGLVNWCVKLNTTLSNVEVEQKELKGRTLLSIPGYDPKEKFEFGVLTSFAYPIEGSDERIVIATTRPETMLGDTAIAVHPDDERYKHLHGKFATHPFVNRRLPIITDSIVEQAFGTGAVKITPAHDPNDYVVGKEHNLPFVSILRDDGTLVDDEAVVGKWKGMKRFHVRVGVVEELKRVGLYVGVKENEMKVPICPKSGDVIEPIIKPQWWVDCQRLKGDVVRRTREGELKIAPKQSESDWFRWFDKIRDWCVSRQLWWGHRIPAYYVKVKGEQERDEDEDENGKIWVVGRTREEAEEKARRLVGDGQEFELEQDQDVLDTWFSSGLWPFSTLGWPDEHEDLKKYYPTSLLETGWDILFLWVARMCLLGVYLTGKMPFTEVYCHAMIRDAHGRKMSKSLGNVIDPLDVIHGVSLETLNSKLLEGNLDDKEVSKAKAGQKKDFPKGIPQCGTDALRFALCAYSGGGRDINLDILRVEGYRKFCNKLFNATRFAMLKLEGGYEPQEEAKPTGKESLVEQWILNKLDVAAGEVNRYLAERNFMAATNSVYNFWLYELCDVYIEAMKPMTDDSAPPDVRKSAQDTLYVCLDYGLRLLHPFMPYVTEELWQRLPRRRGDLTPSIMVSEFPVQDNDFVFEEATKRFDLVFSALKTGRSLAASYTLQSDIQFYIQVQTEEDQVLFSCQVQTIVALTKGCKSATVVRDPTQIPAGCASAVVTSTVVIHTLVRGIVDLQKEIVKCEKKLDLARLNLQKIVKVISQPNYESTVPENVRIANEEKKKTSEAEISTLLAAKDMFAQLQ